jgi:hypothetical protein
LSGAFTSKSKKTTHTNKDGSSHAVEDRSDQGMCRFLIWGGCWKCRGG